MASYPARPRKIAPPHPGESIGDLLEDNGLSLREAAAAMRMSHSGLDQVIKGKSPITPSTAVRLEKYFGGSATLWLDLQRDYDLWHARKDLANELAQMKSIAPKNKIAP